MSERAFPDAADGRPIPPMSAEIWAAGADTETAIFVARQLAMYGIAMIRRNEDGTISYIGADQLFVESGEGQSDA